MSNPFDNVPSSADVPEAVEKKVISNLTSVTERFEAAVSREETTVKNQEELAGALFEIFLDDDGSMKDFAHIAELKSILRQSSQVLSNATDKVENLVKSVPTSIEVHLCDEDRNRLESNFLRLKNLIKLHLPLVLSLGAFVGICLMGSIMICNSASNKKHEYEQRIIQLDRWHQDNAEAISFGQFYRENFPKKYREWQSGRWQQDIAYRDSLIHTHSLDRLRHHFITTE